MHADATQRPTKLGSCNSQSLREVFRWGGVGWGDIFTLAQIVLVHPPSFLTPQKERVEENKRCIDDFSGSIPFSSFPSDTVGPINVRSNVLMKKFAELFFSYFLTSKSVFFFFRPPPTPQTSFLVWHDRNSKTIWGLFHLYAFIPIPKILKKKPRSTTKLLTGSELL